MSLLGRFRELERYEPALLGLSEPLERADGAPTPCTLVLAEALSCARALGEDPEARVHLVYMDPPFATGSARDLTLTVGGGDGESLRVTAYEDPGDVGAYLERMGAVLARLRDLLDDEGSLLLHCDHRVSPSLALLLDEIFGPGDRRAGPTRPGFRNEIVWSYGLGGSSPRCYPKKHDTILWYTKGRRWRFAPPMTPATSARMRGLEKKLPDVWTDVPTLNNMAIERTGYPTQKPLALLERLISAHSRPGDLVYDPYCGSGTTVVAAERLGRAWIGSDTSGLAVHTTKRRLLAVPSASPFSVLAEEALPEAAQRGPELTAYLERAAGERLLVVLEGLTLPAGDPLVPLSTGDPATDLRLLDSWAVDPRYDGRVLRPLWTAGRGSDGAMPLRSPELPDACRPAVLGHDRLGRRLEVKI